MSEFLFENFLRIPSPSCRATYNKQLELIIGPDCSAHYSVPTDMIFDLLVQILQKQGWRHDVDAEPSSLLYTLISRLPSLEDLDISMTDTVQEKHLAKFARTPRLRGLSIWSDTPNDALPNAFRVVPLRDLGASFTELRLAVRDWKIPREPFVHVRWLSVFIPLTTRSRGRRYSGTRTSLWTRSPALTFTSDRMCTTVRPNAPVRKAGRASGRADGRRSTGAA
ncbi:hypothetical protein C8Q80DRAFT_753107 [Daedaleopsis nitida]|nr:hypothetical protein C8Q80DRAFT_753107 [Daedaleopsis nitida]